MTVDQAAAAEAARIAAKGPRGPDWDEPERLPTVQPVWVCPDRPPSERFGSFNYVPGWEEMRVVIPFPYRLVTHPAIGAAYMTLWTDDYPMCAGAVYQAAYDRWGGFRFADEG